MSVWFHFSFTRDSTSFISSEDEAFHLKLGVSHSLIIVRLNLLFISSFSYGHEFSHLPNYVKIEAQLFSIVGRIEVQDPRCWDDYFSRDYSFRLVGEAVGCFGCSSLMGSSIGPQYMWQVFNPLSLCSIQSSLQTLNNSSVGQFYLFVCLG